MPTLSGSIFSSMDRLGNSVGVGTHLGNKGTPYYTNYAAVEPLLERLCVGHLRDDAFYLTGTTKDTNPYPNIRALTARGFVFDLVCSDPLGRIVYPPPNMLETIYGWCGGRGVNIFEGANEPQYANGAVDPLISSDHQGSLYRAVKNSAALKNILVASPSCIQGNTALAMDMSAVVDLVNVHAYAGMEHPETTTATGSLAHFIAASQRFCGVKPVLVSEIGYHTALQTTGQNFPVSEAIKTRYMPRVVLFAFLSGVLKTYLYELMDSFAPDLTNPDSNYGLADHAGNPKPCFFAIRNLMLLAQPPHAPAAGPAWAFSIAADDTSNVQALLLSRPDGSAVLFAWLGVSGWNASTRTALAPVTRPSVLAITGGQPNTVVGHLFNDDGTQTIAPLVPCAGGYALTISDQVTAIEIA